MAESTGSRLTSDDDLWYTKPTDSQTSDNNLGGVSIWCGQGTLRKIIHIMREGDRLELVDRNLPHLHCWAICEFFSTMDPLHKYAVRFFNSAKEERVAHLKRYPFFNVSLSASKDAIVETILWRLKPGSKVRINNSKDKDWSPIGTGHISKEVTYQLKELHKTAAGEEVYVCRNQFKDSEDFVNYCRYDRDHQHNYRRDNNYGRISEWHSKTNIEDFIHEVRVGDRLEFRYYSLDKRWGIYIGQRVDALEQVVLFAHGDKMNPVKFTERLNPNLCVTSIRISVVDGCDQVRINNEDDQKWPPLDRKNILKEISCQLSSRAGTHHKCKALFKDSEDFVNYCRYDAWHSNFGLVSHWGSLNDDMMRAGDRLEFHRFLPYTHWGIYVGEWGDDHDQVVHFTPVNGKGKIFSTKKTLGCESSATDKPELYVESIRKIPGKVRINNVRDRSWPPLDSTTILHKIKYQLKSQSDGHKPVYHLFHNNCEHFVNHCRYRIHQSDQVLHLFSIE